MVLGCHTWMVDEGRCRAVEGLTGLPTVFPKRNQILCESVT